MTIGEANAVNLLLRWIFDLSSWQDTSQPDEADLTVAAKYLADRAYQALHAGYTAADVAEASLQ